MSVVKGRKRRTRPTIPYRIAPGQESSVILDQTMVRKLDREAGLCDLSRQAVLEAILDEALSDVTIGLPGNPLGWRLDELQHRRTHKHRSVTVRRLLNEYFHPKATRRRVAARDRRRKRPKHTVSGPSGPSDGNGEAP